MHFEGLEIKIYSLALETIKGDLREFGAQL